MYQKTSGTGRLQCVFVFRHSLFPSCVHLTMHHDMIIVQTSGKRKEKKIENDVLRMI